MSKHMSASAGRQASPHYSPARPSLANGSADGSSSFDPYWGQPRGVVQSNGVCKGGVNGTPGEAAHRASNGVSNGFADSDDEDDFHGAEVHSCSSENDFHDATDVADFSSDSDSSFTPSRTHGSYRSLVGRLQEEQAKCTALEMSLQQERQRVRALEQAAGSTGRLAVKNGFSNAGSSRGSQTGQQASDDHAQGSGEDIAVARMVAGAVGRATGRAEAQMELEAALQQKEEQLSRLRDKLQYWERMNQEMSQQNTQAIEMLRSRRRVWKTVYRVTYVAGAIVLGVGLLAAVNLATSTSHSEPSSDRNLGSSADS